MICLVFLQCCMLIALHLEQLNKKSWPSIEQRMVLYLSCFSHAVDGQLIILPSGNVDEHLPVVRHTLQLIRLGSCTRESPNDEPPVLRSHSFAQPGSPGGFSAGSPPGSCAVLKDDTELDMFADVDSPKRTRSRLSLPVRKAKSIKYQPLLRPEDALKAKPSNKYVQLTTVFS